MINMIKKLIESDREWNRRHPKLFKSAMIFAIISIILNLNIRFIGSYNELRRKVNESNLSSEISEINLSGQEKVDEFDFIYKTLTENMPSITLFKERYDIDFKKNYEKYCSCVLNTKDDFDYYCTLEGIFSDIPSAHTDMFYPDYEVYKNNYGYNYDKFLATKNLKNYTDYWHDLIDEKCENCYDKNYFIFNYYCGDGKYFFNPDMGIADYTDEYLNSYLTAIDGIPVDEYIKENVMYFKICYDNINNKVYRPQIMFNSVSEYGRKVNVSICTDNGSTVERELYISCADDLIIYHGCVFDERYAQNNEYTESENNGVPYYFFEDKENNLTYAWVSSVDYGFGETIKKSLSEIKTDNVILDLRDNGGGTAYYFYEYLYTPIFNNDYEYDNNYYISETPFNKNNIYKVNLIYDIYSAVKSPINYYYGSNFNVFDNKYKIIEETNHFKCIGGKNGSKKVYVLIGNNTASAADGFAAIIKQGTNAVLIGENTAGEGMGGSYVSVALPESKLAFSYYPAFSLNPDGSNNTVFGTEPNYYVPYSNIEDFILRNKMIVDYGSGYAYDYSNRIMWDNQLKFTLELIKENENDKRNNPPNE